MQNTKVLLVEDNLINQRVAKHMLVSLGYEVSIANHGAEAISILENTVYDIVLMDCQMMEMDGYTATKIIRDQTSKVLNHNVPVIALTAFTSLYNREACLAVGMNGYIEKPVRKNILKEVLEKFTTRQHAEEKKSNASMTIRILPNQTFTIQLHSGRFVEVENISIKLVSPDSFDCHDWNIRQEYFLEKVSQAIVGNLGEISAPTIVCGLECLECGVLPQFLVSCKLISDPIEATYCESSLCAAFFTNGEVFSQSLHQILGDNFKAISWEDNALDYDN